MSCFHVASTCNRLTLSCLCLARHLSVILLLVVCTSHMTVEYTGRTTLWSNIDLRVRALISELLVSARCFIQLSHFCNLQKWDNWMQCKELFLGQISQVWPLWRLIKVNTHPMLLQEQWFMIKLYASLNVSRCMILLVSATGNSDGGDWCLC